MNKVVIIAYNFPPVGGAGVQRSVKFVKYLSKYNWEPVVLTVANPSVPVTDESLYKDIPVGVKIYRAKTLEPSYSIKSQFTKSETSSMSNLILKLKKFIALFLLPDVQILWWPGLALKLLTIMIKEKPAVLFVSAPPFSSFIPVVVVGRMFNVPVVLDYRDEWSFTRSNWENSVNNSFARYFDSICEFFALKKSTRYVTANQSYIDNIYNKYPSIDRAKGAVITNGYDDDDLVVINDFLPEKKQIIITYIGTIWKATSLRNFMAAFDMLLNDIALECNSYKIIINIVGRIVDQEASYFQRYKDKGFVKFNGYIAHDKIMLEAMKSDILLLTLSDLPGAEKIITGKVFEYMSTGKHIFGILPDGETRNILVDNYNNMTLVNPNDVEEIRSALANIVFTIEKIRDIKGKDVSQFTRKKLTYALASLFDSIT